MKFWPFYLFCVGLLCLVDAGVFLASLPGANHGVHHALQVLSVLGGLELVVLALVIFFCETMSPRTFDPWELD